MSSHAAEQYAKFYADMQLERAGLFELVSRAYQPQTVLYPGCSYHVTASFYFPHVVYVDQSEPARQFFAEAAAVQALVDSRKTYGRSAYVRYIHGDYSAGLPLRERNFDLLIALYAGGIAASCGRYVKPGGLLLTNNHHDDAGQAASDGGWELVAVVHQARERYHLTTDDLAGYFVPKMPLCRTDHSAYPVYTRQADYYVFQRARTG